MPSPPSAREPRVPVPGARPLGARLVHRAAPARWPVAVRSAVCMGLPVLVGWLAGDLATGLTATLGGFTGLYGSGRPYRNRIQLLSVVAVALSAAVGLGLWAASITWVGVLVVSIIAATATLLCNALEVGPPGAYQFALVCAIGTGLHTGNTNPAHAALLVLAGGAFAVSVHMTGVVIRPRGPERSAVAAAAGAVADYIDAVGTERQNPAQLQAAQAVYQAWTTVVSRQPACMAPTARSGGCKD